MAVKEELNKIFIATFFEEKNNNLDKLIKKISLKAPESLRIVPNDKIHITWKFIGNIDLKENVKVFSVVKECSHIIKNCTLEFDKLEIWPSSKKPKLIALTTKNYDEKFKNYFNHLDDSLLKTIKTEKEKRGFVPHITVARIKQNKNIKAFKKLIFEPIKLKIKHIQVVKSVDNSNAVSYEILFNEDI